MTNDLPPELGDLTGWSTERHLPVRSGWWRLVSGAISVLLIGLLIVVYAL